MLQEFIRNFSIIAHIDHGKSTLSDRILEITHTISKREFKDQILDSMDLERERGITIKAHAVRINYITNNTYILNLIDTPGHVDFSYEVSRSLSACEGAILLVDAAQGVEAQTLANFYLALENNLTIIPVINKIDLPNADVIKTKKQIQKMMEFEEEEILCISAKTGEGIEKVIQAIITKIPSPKGDVENSLKALVFDSQFNLYRGVIIYIRIFEGIIKTKDLILFMSKQKEYEVEEIGIFTPKMQKIESLQAGEVGYVMANIKNIRDVKIGETLTFANFPTQTPLPGYKEAKPMVFAGFYPVEVGGFAQLKDALEKLSLNDASFIFGTDSSQALGPGFRCGFLGLLHMEIIQERLEREYQLNIITTAPSVSYQVILTDETKIEITTAKELPEPTRIKEIREPYINSTIFTPDEFIGNIIKLGENRRGIYKGMEYIGEKQVMLKYEFPLNEIVLEFYDRLKSITKGYASFDYEYSEYKPSNLVKLDILINKEPVDALSIIVHRDKAYLRGKTLVEKLKEVIPQQLFAIPIQAAIGNKVISRETVKALRKNVLAKCYGGDITRKRKLLEKQKKGKKRMKQFGEVELPQEAFMAILKVD